MKSSSKIAFVPILAVLCFLCFAVIASIINGRRIANFDSSVIGFVQGLESSQLTVIMKSFTLIGSTQSVVVISVCCLLFLFFILRHRLELILFLAVVVGTPIINSILKSIFRRERPTLHRLIEETGFSFPSGHSMAAFALYASIAFLLWRHISTRLGRTAVILFCVFMTVMIGVSRIYLGVHYPSDVVGAYFASAFWFALCVWLFQWYMEHRAPQKNGHQKTSNPT